MKKLNLYIVLLSLFCASCAKKTFSPKGASESPNYYAQWFNEHKNEKGEIPSGMNDLWVAHDKKTMNYERGGGVVKKVTNLASNNLHGGRTRSILVSSMDTTRIFVGSVSGGIWRSMDSGNSWTAINDQSSSLSVTCIIENPFNPKEIYYGTGETRGAAQPPGNGIFKSVDGGLTFNRLSSTANNIDMRFCNYMAHSEVDSATLWVGTASGLYVSKNSGETWTKIKLGSSFNSNISGIISFPDSTIMVSVIGSYRIYKSPKIDSLPFTTVPDALFPKSGLGRVLIANCKAVPNTIYAWFTTNVYTGEADNGVFRSNDGGLTWERTTTELISVGSAQQAYCQMLGVHPRNPNNVMIGATSARYTRNGGQNWTAFSTGHADNHVFCPTGKNSNELFMGNDGGIYKNNWFTLANNPKDLSKSYASSQYYAGNYGPTGVTCIGGTQDNGTWRYGAGALAKSNGGDGAYSHISQQEPTLAYVATQNGALYRKDNYLSNGGTLTLTPRAGMETVGGAANPLYEGVDFINQYEINYADGKQLYYRTGKGIWRTVDKAISWERLNKKAISNITAVGVTNEKDPTVYLGGVSTFYRIDSAATRADSFVFVNKSSKVSAAMRANAWGNISFHPNDKTTMYVGLSSMTLQPRIWKGINVHTDTMKWTDITGNLPGAMSVYQVQAHPDRPDSILLAATAFGLYYTMDGGKNWLKETRVPNVPIFEMKLRVQDKNLFLFTHGRGVWHLELEDLALIRTDDKSSDIPWNLYPNPANNTVQIVSDFPIRNIQLFDLQGKELLNAENSTSLDIAFLPKGIYFVKIFNENGRFSTKKLIKE